MGAEEEKAAEELAAKRLKQSSNAKGSSQEADYNESSQPIKRKKPSTAASSQPDNVGIIPPPLAPSAPSAPPPEPPKPPTYAEYKALLERNNAIQEEARKKAATQVALDVPKALAARRARANTTPKTNSSAAPISMDALQKLRPQVDKDALTAQVVAGANAAFATRGRANSTPAPTVSTPPGAPVTSQDLSQKLEAINKASDKAIQIAPGSTSLGAVPPSASDITRRNTSPTPTPSPTVDSTVSLTSSAPSDPEPPSPIKDQKFKDFSYEVLSNYKTLTKGLVTAGEAGRTMNITAPQPPFQIKKSFMRNNYQVGIPDDLEAAKKIILAVIQAQPRGAPLKIDLKDPQQIKFAQEKAREHGIRDVELTKGAQKILDKHVPKKPKL